MFINVFSELLHIAAETGLIEDPILPKLNEVQDLRVKLEKMKMRMGFAEESHEAKTNCTICEEMVRALTAISNNNGHFDNFYLSMIAKKIEWLHLHHAVTAYATLVPRDVCHMDSLGHALIVEKNLNKIK